MAESWCKVASDLDSDPKIRRAGRLGREVFLFVLRRNARPGNPIPGLVAAADHSWTKGEDIPDRYWKKVCDLSVAAIKCECE